MEGRLSHPSQEPRCFSPHEAGEMVQALLGITSKPLTRRASLAPQPSWGWEAFSSSFSSQGTSALSSRPGSTPLRSLLLAFLTGLLRCVLRIRRSSHFECTMQWFLVTSPSGTAVSINGFGQSGTLHLGSLGRLFLIPMAEVGTPRPFRGGHWLLEAPCVTTMVCLQPSHRPVLASPAGLGSPGPRMACGWAAGMLTK